MYSDCDRWVNRGLLGVVCVVLVIGLLVWKC